MGVYFRYLSLALVVVGSIAMFQNCSSKNFESVGANEIASVDAVEAGLPKEASTPAPEPVIPAVTSCVDSENISVYQWTNSTSDPMTVQGAPAAGARLGRLRIDDGSAGNPFKSSPWPGSDYGWRISTAQTYAGGVSRVTMYMNKWNSTDGNGEYLTCTFGPVLDTEKPGCQVKSPEGKINYQNIGVGLNGVDGFIGYLSCPEKFIACKLERTSRKLIFVNTQNESLQIESNSPFIIKRGCGN